MKSSDMYWLAGILEGEGRFFCKPGGTCTIGIDSTDRDVVERVASLFDSNLNGPYVNGNPKFKLRYQTTVSSSVAASWMMTLYPLMASRRRAKIKESLAVWRQQPVTRKKRTHCIRGGHPLSGDNLYVNSRGERSCKLCFKPASRLARKSGDTKRGLATESSQ